MIDFYCYHNTYETISQQLKGYYDDPKVSEYLKNIDKLAEKFAVEVKDAKFASDNLIRLELYFSAEIKEINQITAETEAQTSAQKYDRMMALGMKLIELKTEIEASITKLKTALLRINLYKADLEASISGLQYILAEGKLVKIGATPNSSSISKLLVTLGMLLFLA